MKTKKIAPGLYKFKYKGILVSIIDRSGDMPDAKGWYYTYVDLDGNFNGAEDIFSAKKLAVEAAVEWVDYLTN